MRRWIGAVVALLTGAPLLAAPAPPDGPLAPVQSTLALARKVVLAGGTRAEQLESLREITGELFDTREMGRRAMGRSLTQQTAEQQEAFLALFDEFMLRSYLQRLLLFRAPRFAFGAVQEDGDTALVKTKILTEHDAFSVSYEMGRRNGRWRATDIVVEGISLRDNFREQFASLLRDRSFDELLELMRRKLRVFEDRDSS